MGNFLSFPATKKVFHSDADDRLFYVVTEMQGWRIDMEDVHTTILDLDDRHDEKNSFFAVYDGHGGELVSKFAGQNVHKRLVNEEAYREKNYELALKRAFLGTDEDILADPAHAKDSSGCTAVTALVTHDGKIYVANAGDSRSVLCVQGEVKPLSIDHKPTSDVETARICNAGGSVDFCRVNGRMAVSRGLGDFEFKNNNSLKPEEQIMTANPDVTVHEITVEDEFLILACDGIWDCLSSQQVVDFVRLEISEGRELTEIGEMICDYCLSPICSKSSVGCDNMTILIVAILHGRTKGEWYSWVTDRVKQGYGYRTPHMHPQIYDQKDLYSFKKTREVFQSQEQLKRRNKDSSGDRGDHDDSGGGPVAANLPATANDEVGSTKDEASYKDPKLLVKGGISDKSVQVDQTEQPKQSVESHIHDILAAVQQLNAKVDDLQLKCTALKTKDKERDNIINKLRKDVESLRKITVLAANETLGKIYTSTIIRTADLGNLE